MRRILFILLFTILFTGCDYPNDVVAEGKPQMFVYKVKEINDVRYGKYKYAITDASGKGWSLISFKEFKVGDTIKITN